MKKVMSYGLFHSPGGILVLLSMLLLWRYAPGQVAISSSKCMLILIISAAMFCFPSASFAAAPPLREQVSLNGKWDIGGEIPEYTGGGIDIKETYQRGVDVPATWKGKIIRVEFEQVNHVADVYINERHVLEHIGAAIPFAVDITSMVTPGESFTLKLLVGGQRDPRLFDAKGRPLWPCQYLEATRSDDGIVDDAWLRAYGKIAIEDAFIKTSFRRKTITVDYTVTNHENSPRTIEIVGEVTPAEGGAVVKAIRSGPVTLAAGETNAVTASSSWSAPDLWMPDEPDLYHLTSRVRDGDVVIDEETRRFGFREIWISGNQFMLNGIRVNLRGDNSSHLITTSFYNTPSSWPIWVDRLMNELNGNVWRWHKHPAHRFALDVSDEKGLLVIEESGFTEQIRQYKYKNDPDVEEYIANILEISRIWMPAWIKAHRNHPSIIMWSAENEFGLPWSFMTKEQVKELGVPIYRSDPTRPVTFEGSEEIPGEPLVNYHYPEVARREPSGSIYSWGHLVHEDKPAQIGEYLYPFSDHGDENQWWQGTWARGLRYLNFSDIRPWTIWSWVQKTSPDDPKIANLRNGYAPVALFDREYDDLGIQPVRNEVYPYLDEGNQVTRTLILYNDEFRDTSVRIEVQIKSGDITHARGRTNVTLPLGEHMDILCSFQVPYVGGGHMDMVLITEKNEIKRFEEVKRFNVRDLGLRGKSSDTVSFDPAP